uniref:Uncharacterized protein n=1 Tax=Cannabis sativa TaxID=3483 RepID=A0A803NW92_CANSA
MTSPASQGDSSINNPRNQVVDAPPLALAAPLPVVAPTLPTLLHQPLSPIIIRLDRDNYFNRDVDSGASNHITDNVNNLHTHDEYNGTSKHANGALIDDTAPSSSSQQESQSSSHIVCHKHETQYPPLHKNSTSTASYSNVPRHINLPFSLILLPSPSSNQQSPSTTAKLPTPFPKPSHPMITRAKAGIHKPHIFHAFSSSPLALLTDLEPVSVAEALCLPK